MKARHLVASLVLVGSLALAGKAQADGLVVSDARLSATARAELKRAIDDARRADPGAFAETEAVASHAQALDRAARKPGAPLTRELKALGPRALLPSLSLLAFDARAASGLEGTARSALELGLVESVGILRDARALPVLAAILEADVPVEVTRTAAAAIGRIGTDESIARLLAASRAASGERRLAVIAGMGACRREAIARALASELDAGPDEATARVVVRALGEVGNAWAWRTLSSGEQSATRALAARSLVAAYLRHSGDVRESAAKALLVVDAPQTATYLREARAGATEDQASWLDRLAERLRTNPAR